MVGEVSRHGRALTNKSQQIYLFGTIQFSQTGPQPCNDTSPDEVSECSPVTHLVSYYRNKIT